MQQYLNPRATRSVNKTVKQGENEIMREYLLGKLGTQVIWHCQKKHSTNQTKIFMINF